MNLHCHHNHWPAAGRGDWSIRNDIKRPMSPIESRMPHHWQWLAQEPNLLNLPRNSTSRSKPGGRIIWQLQLEVVELQLEVAECEPQAEARPGGDTAGAAGGATDPLLGPVAGFNVSLSSCFRFSFFPQEVLPRKAGSLRSCCDLCNFKLLNLRGIGSVRRLLSILRCHARRRFGVSGLLRRSCGDSELIGAW